MRKALCLFVLLCWCGAFAYAQSNANLPSLIPFKHKGKFGFKTQTNQVVINPIYSNVGLFTHGKAIVSKDIHGKRLTGVIDTTGKEIVPIKYSIYAALSNRGQGIAANNFIVPDACFLIIIDEEKYTNRMGVLDRNGDMVLEPDYTHIQPRFLDSVGLVFEVRKRIESDEKTAFYNSVGTCILPFTKGNIWNEWEKLIRPKPTRVAPSTEELLKADTTQPYTYVRGLQHRGFASGLAIVMDRKTTLYGVHNLATNHFVLPTSFRYIHAFGHGYLVCTLPNKKAKIQVYNSSFQLIDSMDEKSAFNHYWGSQFAYTLSGVVYSGNYKPLNQEGNLRPKAKHFEKLGVLLIIDRNSNTACVFDTLGTALVQYPLPVKYLYDVYPYNEKIDDELEHAASIDSLQKIVQIAFAPLSEKSVLYKSGLSLDEHMYYGIYKGKLTAIPATDVERFPMIKRHGVKSVFEFMNGKQLSLPENLRYLLLFGTDSMYAASHITSKKFYQVNLAGDLRLISANERLALIAQLNSGVTPVVNNCAPCTFKQPIVPNQNWTWDYQGFSEEQLLIPLPNLVPQANSSSARIDLSKGRYIFYHKTTLEVVGIYKKHKRMMPTPYYTLFRVNRKNGDLKKYVIKKL